MARVILLERVICFPCLSDTNSYLDFTSLHSLEHNICFHDLPFSLLSSLVSSQYLQNFWWFGCAGSAGLEHGRVYANVGGVTISDPDCNVTVGVMFWFAYFSVVFWRDLHKKEETMVFEAHGMSFPCTELLLFNYAKVNTVFHSMVPLKKKKTDKFIMKLFTSIISNLYNHFDFLCLKSKSNLIEGLHSLIHKTKFI